MTEIERNYYDYELNEFLKPKTIFAVDIGSTSIKAAWIPLGNDRFQIPYIQGSPWNDIPKTIEPIEDKIHCKIIKPDDVRTLLNGLIAQIYIYSNYNNEPILFVITGFSNSLVIGNVGDQSRPPLVLLDDPSLTTQVSEDLKKNIGQILNPNNTADFNVKIQSTLMKLLAVRRAFDAHDQDLTVRSLLERHLGEGISLKQLRFTTVLGLMAGWLSNSASPDFSWIKDCPMPLNDIERGFGDGLISRYKVEQLLKFLGLWENVAIAPNRLMKAGEYSWVYVVNDLTAEAGFLNTLMRYLPEGSVIISFDSVGKIQTSLPFAFPKQLEGVFYTTQRMTGNVNNDWLKAGIIDTSSNFYQIIDGMITEGLHAGDYFTTQNPYLFYPDENEGTGMLLKRQDGNFCIIDQSIINLMSEAEFRLVVAAIAAGVMFGIRQKLEKSPKIGQISNIYIWGGLVKPDQRGWRELALRSMPALPVYSMDITNGPTSAAVSAINYLNLSDNLTIDYLFNSNKVINYIGTGGSEELNELYAIWQTNSSASWPDPAVN